MQNKWYGKSFRLGMIGGGQLGRMFIQESTNFDVQVHVLDPDDNAPCKTLASSFTKGSLTDYDAVLKFGADKDVITVEIENINIEFIELIILYLIIILSLYFFYYKTKTSLILILLALSILKPYQYYLKEKCNRQRFICLMGFKNADIYVCVDGEKAFVYGDSLSFTQKSIKNDLNRFFLKNNTKSKYMIQEKDTFTSTNFRSIQALGFQFFDRIVTMQNTAHLSGQSKVYCIIQGEEKIQLYRPKISANNLIISHKTLKRKRESINKELCNVYGKKINISNRFRIICRF